jgi:glutaredoxin-related protein
MEWVTKRRAKSADHVPGIGRWYYNDHTYRYSRTPAASDRLRHAAFDNEVIKYTRGLKKSREFIGGRDSRPSNNCIHRHVKQANYPINGTYFGPNGYVTMSNYIIDSAPATAILAQINQDLEEIDATFNSRAFEGMKPNLETALSLSNFIAELTDVKHLLRFFTKWNGPLRKVAEGHLSYAFGIRPFIQDVKLLYKILTDHQSFIDSFLAARNTFQRRHWAEEEPVEQQTTGWTNWQGISYVQYRYVHRYKSIHTATMVYSYNCPDLEGWRDELRALCDLLGLRLTLSVVWEAIPFSFVVDWFFRVQKFLEAHEEPLVKVDVTVYDYVISHKFTNDSKREWKFASNNGNSQHWIHTDIEYSVKSYKRRVMLPDSDNTFIDSGQYGTNQLALSASLLAVLSGGRR